jgi:hypothetical protein
MAEQKNKRVKQLGPVNGSNEEDSSDDEDDDEEGKDDDFADDFSEDLQISTTRKKEIVYMDLCNVHLKPNEKSLNIRPSYNVFKMLR